MVMLVVVLGLMARMALLMVVLKAVGDDDSGDSENVIGGYGSGSGGGSDW